MLLDLNFKLKDHNDVEIKDRNEKGEIADLPPVAFFLAQLLMGKPKEIDPGKAYDIALSLRKTGTVELDKTDAELILKNLKNDEVCQFTNELRVPIIEALKALYPV